MITRRQDFFLESQKDFTKQYIFRFFLYSIVSFSIQARYFDKILSKQYNIKNIETRAFCAQF